MKWNAERTKDAQQLLSLNKWKAFAGDTEERIKRFKIEQAKKN